MLKKCLYCYKEFEVKNKRKKYCSLNCKKKAEYNRNKDRYLTYFKKYGNEKKEQIKEQRHNHYLENRERMLKEKQDYYLENKETIAEYKINWAKKNRQKINTRIRNFIKENINYKLSAYLRVRLNSTLKGNTKSASATKLLGCSIEELKKHLESQFKEGMSWDNHGRGFNGKGMQEWHIDHIKPCASFDLSKLEEQRKCFHYSNLQPLWAKENRMKGSKS